MQIKPANSFVVSCAAFLAALLVSLCTPAFGRDLGSLKGAYPWVQVILEDIPNLPAYSLVTKQQLATNVELELRKAGFIVTRSDYAPYFYVNVNVLPISHIDGSIEGYSVSISAELHETVNTKDGRTVYGATTWNTGSTLTVPANNLGSIGSEVSHATREFANDYLAANPNPDLKSAQWLESLPATTDGIEILAMKKFEKEWGLDKTDSGSSGAGAHTTRTSSNGNGAARSNSANHAAVGVRPGHRSL